MTELDLNRQKINEVDKQIASLFEQRMDAAKKIGLYKKEYGLQIFDPAREEEVCKRELDLIKNPDYKSYYLEFLHGMMDVTKKYQRLLLQGSRISYCGIQGAWANIAARRIFPEGECVSYPTFDKAYESVVKGECDFAVLPIENSFVGDVTQVFDLMYKGTLYVNGMYSLHINQSLLGVKGAKLSDIKKVISHQQAIDKCSAFIQQHGFETQSCVNTAVAAQEVAAKGDVSVAAIASEESAKLYGLHVINKAINQDTNNTTRFAVFSTVLNKAFSEDDCVFQLMFTVKNIPGSLARAITAFGEAGFNLKALRSRPIKNVPWQYYFYVEGEGSLFSERGKSLVEKLSSSCEELKILGHHSKEISI